MQNYNENGINGITSCISPCTYKTVLWQARAEWMGNFHSFHFSAAWKEFSIKPKEWENKVFLSTDAGAKKRENSSWRLIIMQHNAIQWISVPFYILFFLFYSPRKYEWKELDLTRWWPRNILVFDSIINLSRVEYPKEFSLFPPFPALTFGGNSNRAESAILDLESQEEGKNETKGKPLNISNLWRK